MLPAELFNYWQNPDPAQIAPTIVEFLHQLGRPSVIHLGGADSSRTRLAVTLLHGNEPSGLKAFHRLLREGHKPRVDMLLIVAAVETALTEPLFSHRFVPGEKDMNRLFAPPFEGRQGALASELLSIIEDAKPEAVLDLHNTSGEGPSFAVCTQDNVRCLDLAALFTRRLIITDIRLKALMEAPETGCPTVTIECGGAAQQQSDVIAFRGMQRFFERNQLYTSVVEEDMDIYRHPIRLELRGDSKLCYADQPVPEMDVTLPNKIERHNFGVSRPDAELAWLGPKGIGAFCAKDSRGNDRTTEFFVERDGKLYPRQALKLFMVTTNPDIAVNDCLFYAVKEQDHQIEHTASDDAVDPQQTSRFDMR